MFQLSKKTFRDILIALLSKLLQTYNLLKITLKKPNVLHLPLDLRFIFISSQEYPQSSIKRDFIVMRKLTAAFVMELKIANLRGKSGKMSIFHLIQYSDFDNIEHLNLIESSSLLVTFLENGFFLFYGKKLGKK